MMYMMVYIFSRAVAMHRTQVYLTEEETTALKELARRTGQSFSATLREAIDDYIARHRSNDFVEAVENSFGCWRDRRDVDLAVLRQEWEARDERLR